MTVFRWMGVLALALVVSACGNDFVPSVINTGTAVLTYRAPETDFGTFSTYAIVSKMTVVDDTTGVPVYSFQPAPEILGAVERNMAARGYRLVARIDPENPPPVPPSDADLAINVSVLVGTDYAYVPCDYWAWWGVPDLHLRSSLGVGGLPGRHAPRRDGEPGREAARAAPGGPAGLGRGRLLGAHARECPEHPDRRGRRRPGLRPVALPGHAMIRIPARVAAVLAVVLALLGARPAVAKGYLDDWHPYQTYWAVGWSAAVPVTSLRAGFISDTGWLGGGADIRIGVAGRLAVGVSGTWTWFDQTFPSLTLEQPPSLTFTGPVYRRLSAITVLATAHYYLTSGDVQPFVGVGVGGVWISTLEQVVNRPQDGNTSGLAVAGELGILFTVAQQLGLYLSGRYQFNLATIDGVANPQWASGQAGVAYYF